MYIIISCTNRPNSVTRQLSSIYQKTLTELDIESKIIDLQDLPGDYLESALYGNSGKNESFNPTRKVMAEAKKFIFIIPEYNGSFPGVLKAFIDGLEFPATFTNKKCALVGLSSGTQGGGLALSHLTDILNYCGTHVLALKLRLFSIDNNIDLTQLKLKGLYQELLEQQAKEFISF